MPRYGYYIKVGCDALKCPETLLVPLPYPKPTAGFVKQFLETLNGLGWDIDDSERYLCFRHGPHGQEPTPPKKSMLRRWLG